MAERKIEPLTKQGRSGDPENVVITPEGILTVDINKELLDKYRDVEEGDPDVRKGEGLSLEIVAKRYATQARNFKAITKARVDSLRTSPTADLSIEGLSYIEPSEKMPSELVSEEVDKEILSDEDKAIEESGSVAEEKEAMDSGEPDRIKAFFERSAKSPLQVEEMEVDEKMQNLTEAEAQMLKILLGKLNQEPEKPDISDNIDKDKGEGDER